MEAIELKTGDVVSLKCDFSVRMVISHQQSDYVYRCKWLDKDGRLQEADFNYSMLRIISS